MPDEIEREPSPTTTHATRMPSARGGGSRGDTPHTIHKRPLLLEHAFGAQLVRGSDEWTHVQDVIRSSFLLVAKELKRHDRRLQALEASANSADKQHRIVEQEQTDRWRGLQTQVVRFGDGLTHLTLQLQQANERDASVQEQLRIAQQTAAMDVKSARRSADERHGEC